MNLNFGRRLPECFGASLLIVMTAVGAGSLLACVLGGQTRAIPLAAIPLGLFLIFDLWWIILGFSIWVTWFLPRKISGWLFILVIAGVSGIIASWRFQVVRPWDFYHEADGSMPGWEPVHMASLTTAVSCITAAISVMITSLVFTRGRLRALTSQPKCH